VQEVIDHQDNRLLVDFFDIQAIAATAVDALANPGTTTRCASVPAVRSSTAMICGPSRCRRNSGCLGM